MKILTTMTEALGNLVVINGRFIAIEDTDKAEDGKGLVTIVNVYASDKKIREQEIYTAVRSFCSSSGGGLNAGETRFNFTHIWRSNPDNDPILTNHKESTKMVAVKNEETQEFFLVMNEGVSLRDANDFLRKVNSEESELLRARGLSFKHYRRLAFPHETMLGELKVSGNDKFEVVMNGGIVVIKLCFR